MKAHLSIVAMLFILLPANTQSQDIFRYAEAGDIDSLKSLLAVNPRLLESRDDNGKTVLSIAVQKGHAGLVKYLIARGADVNTHNNYGTTPLHYASYYGQREIVRLLIEKKAQLDSHSEYVSTPLFFAVTKGHADVARILIEAGAGVDIADRQNKTPLHAAAQGGHVECVRLLLDAGADRTVITESGETILHSACIGGKQEIVNQVADSASTFGDRDNLGRTPLFDAAENGNAEVVNAIVAKTDPDFSLKCSDGSTYLHAAAEGGLKEFAAALIDKGISVNTENMFGLTPLDIATKKGNAEMSQLLKRHGATIGSAPDSSGEYVDRHKPGLTPVLFAPGIVSTPDFNERDVTFTPDGDELYFTRWPINNTWNIMVMKKQGSSWVHPQKASIASDYVDAEACVTHDGKKIFFISNRPRSGAGSPESMEIWFAARDGGGWSSPHLLGDKFKGGYYPTFTDSGTMYFTDAKSNIARSQLVNGEYGDVLSLSDSVNTSASEYNSLIAPDESYLIFTSKGRGKGYGNDDLYISFRRTDGTWTEARNMGPRINSFAREYCPALSHDGKYLFFCSTRLGTEDIWWVDAKCIEELKKSLNVE